MCANVARLIVYLEDWYCHLSYNPSISSATTYECSRLLAQLYFCFRHQSSTKESLISRFLGFALSYLKLLHTCTYGGTSATTKTRYNIDSTTDAATGHYCWNFVSQTTKHQQRKRRQFWVYVYSSRVTFQLMFMHACVSIERLLWPVMWAVVASYDRLYDRSPISTTSSKIINHLLSHDRSFRILFDRTTNVPPTVRSSTTYRRAIASENRVDWLYFDLLSLVARFQNCAIRCDWGFSDKNEY
jgi:hypothetical protein